MALWSDSPSSFTASADWTPARLFKQATGPESSGDELGILEDDCCIDTLWKRRRACSDDVGCQDSKFFSNVRSGLHVPWKRRSWTEGTMHGESRCRNSSSPITRTSPESTGSPLEALHSSDAPFCRSWMLSLIRDVAAAGRAVRRSARRRWSLPAQT